MSFYVRFFEPNDAEAVSALIISTLRISNAQDYSHEAIDSTAAHFTPELVLQRASWTHFYVCCCDAQIVGCGAIGPFWGKDDESGLFNIFVLPEYQGRGVGRRIIEALEADEFFLRAKRTEVAASITGHPFYLKMGYAFKNGIQQLDEEGCYRMEKHQETPRANQHCNF